MKGAIRPIFLIITSMFIMIIVFTFASCNDIVPEKAPTNPNITTPEEKSSNTHSTDTKDTSNNSTTNNASISNNSSTSSTTNTTSPTEPNNPETNTTEEDLFKDKTGKLSTELKDEILNAYFEQTYQEKYKEYYYSPNQIYGTCYGVFDDSCCLILENPFVGYPSVVVYIEIAGCEFMFGSTNTMVVYNDGEFYGLEKAYENGILNDAEIEELYNFYTETKWGK